MEIQEGLGSDMAMCLDECTPYPVTPEGARRSLELTRDWARRCRRAHHSESQALFGIVQGSIFQDLRRESAEVVAARRAETIIRRVDVSTLGALNGWNCSRRCGA